MHQDIRG